jgi:hypothetical protein
MDSMTAMPSVQRIVPGHQDRIRFSSRIKKLWLAQPESWGRPHRDDLNQRGDNLDLPGLRFTTLRHLKMVMASEFK